MRIAHEPAFFDGLRTFTVDEPLRLIVSGCLAGRPVGVNGTDYGLGAPLQAMLALPTVSVVNFCPEDFAIGTPRTMPDIHGGDGHAVLAGSARVLDEHGVDLTAKMIAGAQAMLAVAQAHRAEMALLTDSSAACGTQVISDGCRYDEPRRFTAGTGVAAALLLQHGIAVLAQRDHRSRQRLWSRLDPTFTVDPAARDHHETDWYRGAFPV